MVRSVRFCTSLHLKNRRNATGELETKERCEENNTVYNLNGLPEGKFNSLALGYVFVPLTTVCLLFRVR